MTTFQKYSLYFAIAVLALPTAGSTLSLVLNGFLAGTILFQVSDLISKIEGEKVNE